MTEGDPDDERDDDGHERDAPDESASDDPLDDGDESPEKPREDGDDSPADPPADGGADEDETTGDGAGSEESDGNRRPGGDADDEPTEFVGTGEAGAADQVDHPGPFLDEGPDSDDGDHDGVEDPREPDDDHAPTITGGAAPPEPDEPEPVGHSGAPDDQEMPLTAHIEEMVKRLLVVIVVMSLVSAVVFPFADRLINFLWFSFLPGQPADCAAVAAADGTVDAASTEAACPRLYHPLALVLSRLKVASLSGFIVALPVFVYETYLFMRPGLYPNERRYYLASVPTSLVLAAVGVLFAYFLVLPLIFTYFLGYSQPVANIAFGLSETFGLILLMLGMFAAIFQIPLFLMLAIMMGVTTRRWLEDRRLYFWFGFAGVAFIFSPDPTGMAPFIVALTMVGLFEGTLLLLRWTGR